MSCLFRSLATFLPKEIGPNKLRNIICDYLSGNPKLIDNLKANQIIKWENGTNIQQYIHRMRHNSSWGGAIEIRAYCDIYKRNVVIWSIPNKKFIEFISKHKNDNVDKLYWTGNHYEPLK